MTDHRQQTGRDAERIVADWLVRQGWTILANRFRRPMGELDLVAIDPGGTLVGVEVKARRTARTGSAVESVDRRRIRRLRATLSAFLAEQRPGGGRRADGWPGGIRPGAMRIDLAAVVPGDGVWTVSLLRGIDGW
jgi:putative endonuclease